MPDRPSDRQLAPWEAVLAQALQQDEPERTALEEMQAAQDSATNTGYLLQVSEAFWWLDVVPQIDEMIRQRIGPREYERYMQEPGTACPAAGAARARDRRPPDRGLTRRHHRRPDDRAPVDRRWPSRPPGKRTGPGDGARRGTGLSGRPRTPLSRFGKPPGHSTRGRPS